MADLRHLPKTDGASDSGAASETIDRWAERLSEGDRRMRALVRERPLATVLGALLLGYAVSRIATRL
jgi:hypothetical protein